MIITNELGTPQLNTVHNCDALRLLHNLASRSVDAIISDPPYNMTELAFEQATDWQAFWVQARRVLKCKNSPVILFSQQPFATDLIMSNRKGWRYEIIWEKTMPVGFLNANKRPLQAHENIQVFGDGSPEYFPQMETSDVRVSDAVRKGDAAHYNSQKRTGTYVDDGSRYPRSVWKFAQRENAFSNTKTLHPTQKPVNLMERLILTYTQPGWLIVDPFAGSGTTGAAAQNTGRNYIMGELDSDTAQGARKRLALPYNTPMFAALVS